jgi:hypothetical protein
MCTGFVKKGKDLIIGYNLDIDPSFWNYKLYLKDDAFYIGIKVKNKVFKTHGINKNVNYAILPYMNDLTKGTYKRGKNHQRIDLLVDNYIANKLSYKQVLDIVKTKNIINVPGCSMHSFFIDNDENILLIEPGVGYKEVKEDYAVIANFPLLEEITDYSPLCYGKPKYDIAVNILANSDNNFSIKDAFNILEKTCQDGQYATRVSFVYSKNEHCVYYALNNNFNDVKQHLFE